jgi:multiple antibiotic resistance protein
MMHLFNYFHEGFTFTFISLFAVVNPIGLCPFFYSLTTDLSPAQRNRLAWRVALYSSCLLLTIYLIGSQILNFFGISLPALQVTGGIIVFATSWKLLTGAPISQEADKPSTTESRDLAFYPLTMPLTAGAGSMAVVIALAAQQIQDQNTSVIAARFGSVCGILIVCLMVGISYSLSGTIYRRLGNSGAEVLTRISSIILLAVAVTIIWSGLSSFVQELIWQSRSLLAH